MKKILFIALALVSACASANAQYFSTNKGRVLNYKGYDKEAGIEETVNIKTTYISVETDSKGVIKATAEEAIANTENPLEEMKTPTYYAYNPETDVTTVTVMTGQSFKNQILTTIQAQAAANNQHISDMQIDELANGITVKGDLAFDIDPKAPEGTKLPNATIRLSMAQMAQSGMTMNLWQVKYLGIESVTTEAGTFECAKVSYVFRLSATGSNVKENVTEWYAKDLGLVRKIKTDKKGEIVSEQVLTSVIN